jgi:hypothetical protein
VQLDKARIVVRERSFLDVLDLSLQVTRRCAGPLAMALAVGIAPMFLLNAYLLSSLEGPDETLGFPLGYMVLLVVCVLWEIPLATAPATLYLGQFVFHERPSASRAAADFVKSLPQLILYQLIYRAVLVWLAVTWLWLFSQYNYLNEVILLERNPLRQKSPARPSTQRRCQTLHSRIGGDLLARSIGSAAIGGLLLLSFWVSIWVFRGLLFSDWEVETAMFTHYFQASVWLVVGFFTVVRFLSYLDLRIRREGWEVELMMRAESQRLAGPEAN